MCYSAAVSCSYACVDQLLQILRDHTTMYYIVRLITLGVYVYMCSIKLAVMLLLYVVVHT
jgi:undecaprenyl pyrophosphate phosphatase UppP